MQVNFLLLVLWLGSLLSSYSLVTGCAVKQPAVSNNKYSSPASDHLRFTDPCTTCHELNRPKPNVDIDSKTRLAANFPHGFSRNCAECHKYDPVTPYAALPYSHSPTPVSCLGCHSIIIEAKPHEARGDCVSCHAFSDWAKLK